MCEYNIFRTKRFGRSPFGRVINEKRYPGARHQEVDGQSRESVAGNLARAKDDGRTKGRRPRVALANKTSWKKKHAPPPPLTTTTTTTTLSLTHTLSNRPVAPANREKYSCLRSFPAVSLKKKPPSRRRRRRARRVLADSPRRTGVCFFRFTGLG